MLFAYVHILSLLYLVKLLHYKVFVQGRETFTGPQVSLPTTGEIGLEYESSLFDCILL